MNDVMLRIALVGAAGRMGRRMVALLADHPGAKLAAAIDRVPSADAPDRGPSIANADVVIDFSAPAACSTLLPLAVAHGRPYVVASTGLDAPSERVIAAAAQSIPVLVAANLSLGVNVLVALVEQAARLLGPAYDAEIMELHHRKKRDAPSGTAHVLAAAVERARGELEHVTARETRERGRGDHELGIASMRGGDAAGEHTVYFLGAGERVELTHRATDAGLFARGALRAAEWLVHEKPGRYGMRDVVGALGRGEG